MVTKVLSVPLQGKASRFTLSSIPLKARISEMEFYFPLRPYSPETLSDMFVFPPQGGGIPEEFPHQMESLTFEPAKGFMKGLIDLVFQHEDAFYLVDWKSNYLGNKVEDYHQEALARVMTGEHYNLQYHLYAVALHQYLRRRFPHYQYERQFGGVYYLFLRGLDPEKGPGFGVYHARPSGELIEELCDKLIDR